MIRFLSVSLLVSAAIAQGWVDRTPANAQQSPSPRTNAAMCWDPVHGYVLLFGGIQPSGGSVETWTWNGTQWTRRLTNNPTYSIAGVGGPSAPVMTFHPPTNQVVMLSDTMVTHVWTGTDWQVLPAQTPGGPANFLGDLALAHDPVRSQTVLYVGTRNGLLVSQTYLWDGTTWTLRPTATVPWPVQSPTLAFDPVVGRLVLGTSSQGITAFHEWTGTNWQQRSPANPPAAVGTFACDTARQCLVLFDGVTNGQPNHTWRLSNGVLQNLAPGLEPARRFGAAMAYDPIRQRTVMFGGAAAVTYSQQQGYQMLAHGDTWEFELGAGSSYTAYGAGCAGSRGVPTLSASFGGVPRVGQTFQATVTNLPLQGLAVMFLGLSNTTYGGTPLPFSLGVLGAPGCSVLASGDDIGLVTDVLGTGFWQWTVPNAPGASFYNQVFVFDATANALGLTTSNGGHGVIGF